MGLSLTFLIEPVKANVCSFYYPRPLGEARNLRLVYEKLFGFNVISLYYLGIFVLFAWTFCVSTPSPSLFRLQNPRAVQDKRKSRDGGSTVCFWILLFFFPFRIRLLPHSYYPFAVSVLGKMIQHYLWRKTAVSKIEMHSGSFYLAIVAQLLV